MDNIDKVIELGEIRNYVRKQHREFVKKYGVLTDKVSAEYTLSLNIIMAKLHAIVDILRREGVISSMRDNTPKSLELIIDGYLTEVVIKYDINVIVFSEGGMPVAGRWIEPNPSKVIHSVENGYNWFEVAKELLDFIHVTVYRRKDATEAMINNVFKGDKIG